MTKKQRLQQQIDFIIELDKLKRINRRSLITDSSRTENSAEHSWHIATMALVLAEYAQPEVNIDRVVRMLLLHDIVEIDAGDTFIYDESAQAHLKKTQENLAAQRIYGVLPSDLGSECIALWQEFEEQQTADAKFAAGLDRLQPLLQNYVTKGGPWCQFGITAKQIIAKNKSVITAASPSLWEFSELLIQTAINKGYITAT